MYARTSKKSLPWLALVLGIIGLVLRQSLYALAVDSRGLLVPFHPLEIALWCLTAAALGYLIWSAWTQGGEPDYEANFPPSLTAAAGHVLAGAGILATVLLSGPQTGGVGGLWRLLGFLACPCLAAAGICRGMGKKPFFLLHMVPCLFLMLHIVAHYRLWSSDPQLQDYVFSLFACLSLMLFAFYNGAYDADICHRRMQLGTGLAAVYLCTVCLTSDAGLWLNLGGIAWAVSGLCCLEGKKGERS